MPASWQPTSATGKKFVALGGTAGMAGLAAHSTSNHSKPRSDFAALFGFNLRSLHDWEQGRRRLVLGIFDSGVFFSVG
jgi:hypothetical protein